MEEWKRGGRVGAEAGVTWIGQCTHTDGSRTLPVRMWVHARQQGSSEFVSETTDTELTILL